jgi:succinate dehydrogenase hydrophobic anchor subunit
MRIILAILVLTYSIWMFYDTIKHNAKTHMDRTMKVQGIFVGILGLILVYLILTGKWNIK